MVQKARQLACGGPSAAFGDREQGGSERHRNPRERKHRQNQLSVENREDRLGDDSKVL